MKYKLNKFQYHRAVIEKEKGNFFYKITTKNYEAINK